jgi:hypothetical protein
VVEQRILRGTTPTLVSYPRLRPDRLAQAQPTGTPRVKLAMPAVEATAFANAVADTLSATVTASAAEGESELAITSSTIVAGRQYLVGFDGRTLVVEARSGGTGQTTMRLAQPLPYDVPDDATVTGFAVSIALTAEQTEQVGEASALWEAVVDGGTLRWSSLFRVVSRMPTALLTPAELVRAYPSIRSLKPAAETTWDEVITAAWEHQVVPLLEAKGAFEEDVVSDATLVPLHALACLVHLAAFNFTLDQQMRDSLATAWSEKVSTTFARKSYAEAIQAGEDDAAPQPRQPGNEPNRARMRLTR